MGPIAAHTAIAATGSAKLSAIVVPTPVPSKGQLLVRIKYAGVMPTDVYIVEGKIPSSYPVLLGWNAAGEVVQVGEDVKAFNVGDEVIGVFFGTSNSLQQYGLYPYQHCAKIPPGISLQAAATIPENFITAFYTLYDCLSLPLLPEYLPSTPHHSLAKDHSTSVSLSDPFLIYGAGSTVGQFFVQLLAMTGFTTVIAIASPKHADLLLNLGASHVIDYHSLSLEKDVLDATGGKGIVIAMDCIATTSTLELIAGLLSNENLTTKARSVAVLLPIKVGGEDVFGGKFVRSFSEDTPSPFADDVNVVPVGAMKYLQNAYLYEHLMNTILPSLLTASRPLRPNQYVLVDESAGGFLERVQKGVDMYRNGDQTLRGKKLIVTVG